MGLPFLNICSSIAAKQNFHFVFLSQFTELCISIYLIMPVPCTGGILTGHLTLKLSSSKGKNQINRRVARESKLRTSFSEILSKPATLIIGLTQGSIDLIDRDGLN